MRTLGVTLFALLLALAGTAAFAETATCPSMTQVQSPCPIGVTPTQTTTVTSTTCPSVVQAQSCLQPCPVMPASLPAALGAGPASSLTSLPGDQFDKAYVTSMYQLSTEISALTTQGIAQVTDKNLHDLSVKMRNEQTSQNEKRALWYRQAGFGTIPVNYSRVQAVTDSIVSPSNMAFDHAYANALIGLLSQQRDAAMLVADRSGCPEIRNQAGIEVKTANNEINALQKWLNERPCVTAP